MTIMGPHADIADLRSRLLTELLPGLVAEVEAIGRRVAARECGVGDAWQEMRAGAVFAVSGAFARLARAERAVAAMEHEAALAGSVEADAVPVGKLAAANDGP